MSFESLTMYVMKNTAHIVPLIVNGDFTKNKINDVKPAEFSWLKWSFSHHKILPYAALALIDVQLMCFFIRILKLLCIIIQ